MAFDPNSYLSGGKTFNPDDYLSPSDANQNPIIEQQPSSSPTLLSPASRQLPIEQQQQMLDARDRQLAIYGDASPVGPTASTRDAIIMDAYRKEAPVNTVFAQDLQEIGAAPELREISLDGMMRGFSAGLMTNEAELAKALQSQIPGAELSQDPIGNALIKMPSGETYALNRPGLSGQDFVQFAIRALGFIPAARASSLIGSGIKSGVTEGAFQAAEGRLGGDANIEDIALSSALGIGAKGIENLAGATLKYRPGIPQNEIIQAGKSSDIPIMTSDVIPPQTFASRMALQTGEKIPIAGTGTLRQQQQNQREKAVQDIADKYNEFSYKSIVDSLKFQKNKIKNAASNVLGNVGNKLDDLGDISLENTASAIQKSASELSKSGVIKSPDALNEIRTLVNALNESPQTFTSLKENRAIFRDLIKKADGAERSQLTSRAKSLLQSIEKGMGDDMNAMARNNLSPSEFSKWKNANSIYFQEAQKMTKSRLKNVLDKGDVTPESVNTMLFSQKPSEVNSLYKSLTNNGRQNARAAIISKVVRDLNGRGSGLTPNSFSTEMKKYGLQTGTFFKGEEKRALNGLLKALNATRRSQDATVVTPTGQQLLGPGMLVAAATDLGATLGISGTAGGIARTYESTPVRNILLKINSTSPKTEAFDKLLLELNSIIQPSAQAIRNIEKDE